MKTIFSWMGLAVFGVSGLAWVGGLGAADASTAQGTVRTILEVFREHQERHPAGDAAFSFDPTAWQEESMKDLPIGVFDSGIGGLTVLEAILKQDDFNNTTLQPGADGRPDFEKEKFIYFGDQANMPYGNYPASGRTDYLKELILKDAVFLLGKRFHPAPGQNPVLTKPAVKAIVIACNTATAYGLEDIRQAVAAWKLPVPVIGVVEAGARGVLKARPETAGAVAVMATVGTCSSGAYPKAIGATLGRAGRRPAVIVQQGSTDLAGVVEGNPAFTSTAAETALRDVKALLTTHRDSGERTPIDTVVLGCTHFPLVRQEIEDAFATLHRDPAWAELTSAPRLYVDPAACTARELFRTLAGQRIRADEKGTPSLTNERFFLSVAAPSNKDGVLNPDGSLTTPYKYSRLPGQLEIEDTVNIPLTPATLPASSATLVRTRLPMVWERLRGQP